MPLTHQKEKTALPGSHRLVPKIDAVYSFWLLRRRWGLTSPQQSRPPHCPASGMLADYPFGTCDSKDGAGCPVKTALKPLLTPRRPSRLPCAPFHERGFPLP